MQQISREAFSTVSVGAGQGTETWGGSGAHPLTFGAICLEPQDVVDAYHFLVARWLVLRQQMLDLRGGAKWNQIIHRPVFSLGGPNPNFDLIESDAWIALSKRSCTILELPPIQGRYHTVQILNGWGEVIANINERTFPHHPSGRFALCLAGAEGLDIPDDALRIDLPCSMARMKIAIQAGPDPAQARELEMRISLRASGEVPEVAATDQTEFRYSWLLSADCFDLAERILALEDVIPGKEAAKCRTLIVAAAAADSRQRREITRIIRKFAVPPLFEPTCSYGSMRSEWMSLGRSAGAAGDYGIQAAKNLTDLWANTSDEVLTFHRHRLGGGGFVQKFSPEQNPAIVAEYGWSVTCVDSERLQPAPNLLGRHSLNSHSELELNGDGSLELCFGPELPAGCPVSNWLPTPAGSRYNLVYRFYAPFTPDYFPPPLSPLERPSLGGGPRHSAVAA